MPLISTHTNIGVSREAEKNMKEKLGKAIQLIPGKSEAWLMLEFLEKTPMYFKGSDAPCALAEVKIFGRADKAAYEKLTGAITQCLSSELAIPADRIYVKYEEADYWGWNGSNF